MSTVITALVTCDRCGKTADPSVVDGGLSPSPMYPESFTRLLEHDYCAACVRATRTFLRQPPLGDPVPDTGHFALKGPDMATELKRLYDELSPQEYELAANIARRTGAAPKVQVIGREGIPVAAHVTYRYLNAKGEEQTRTCSKENGRATEMLLLALRAAVRSATQDHVKGRT